MVTNSETRDIPFDVMNTCSSMGCPRSSTLILRLTTPLVPSISSHHQQVLFLSRTTKQAVSSSRIMVTLNAFQRHMTFFAQPRSTKLTFTSSLHSFLSLGLDFPVACALSFGLRITYSPFPHYFTPIDISRIPPTSLRTQLEDVPLNQHTYTRSDLVNLYTGSSAAQRKGWIGWIYDYTHVNSFWAIAADTETHLVDERMVRRFQEGTWGEAVREKRKSRRKGVGEVLPFWRGGPISVVGHSWFVRRLFGVRVYEP